MKILYSIALLALLPLSAQALEINTSCSGSRYYGAYKSSCSTSIFGDPERDYAQEAEDARAKDERIKKWESFCKPVRTFDNYGVARLIYAKQRCEYGRSE